MKTTYMGDTSAEHTALRFALKAGTIPPHAGQHSAPPIPILNTKSTPATAGTGEGSIQVGGPEAEAEHMLADSDDIANHDFPIPPLSQHRAERRHQEMQRAGQGMEANNKREEEQTRRGTSSGKRSGDRQSSGNASTIMDQNKTLPTQDSDAEPRNDSP